MVASKPISSRGQPTWRVEVPEELTVALAGSSGYSVPVEETLVAHRYSGQILLVTSGTHKGDYYTVSDNAVGTLTLEESVGTDLAHDDLVAVTTWGQPPGSVPDDEGNITDYFGAMLQTKLPMQIRTFFEGRYHGSDNMPAIEEIISMANEYPADFELILKNCAVLAMCFGEISETTTDFDAADPAQTFSANLYPGLYTIPVASSTNYTVGDLVLIDGGTDGVDEVGKIASKPDGTHIKLQHPLKNYHSTGAFHVHEIKCTVAGVPDSVITHVMTIGFNLPTFTYEAGLRRERRWTGQDMVFQFMGLMVSKLAIKSSPGETPLTAGVTVKGLHMRYLKADGLTELNEVSAKAEVGFDMGTWKPCGAEVTFNGVAYQEAAEFNCSIERDLTSPIFHDAGNIPYSQCGDPKVHYEGSPKVEMDVQLPLRNRNIVALLRADTEFDVNWVYSRGTTEELTVCLQDCHLKGPLMDEWPDEGMIPQNADCLAKKMYIQVKDFVPYYVM